MIVQIVRAKRNGIKHPVLAYRAAKKAGIPFWVACAFLMQETGGGANVWGHDPTWMVGYPKVNADVYAVYEAHRERFGFQGVGPMQLTYGPLQDQAYKVGVGPWDPYSNMLTGFNIIAGYRLAGKTWYGTALRYNGSAAYADQMIQRFYDWRDILGGGK